MEPKRVVVTGIGLLTPIGNTPAAIWESLLAGKTGIHTITRFDPSPFRSHMAAEVNDFDPHNYMDAKQVRRLDRFSQFSLAASQLAVADSRLRIDLEDSTRVGIYMGSALGGIAFGEEQHASYVEKGVRSVNPALALAVFGGASSSNIAMSLGVNGPNIGNSNSCASGPIAMGEAFRLIKRGEADVMLAGAVEVPLAPLTFGAFAIIKAMSTRNDDPEHACRPFDADRDGFVMGEAAAVFVLEEREHALRRDAHLYGEIIGYGTTNDAYHMTAPRPDGREAARAITMALTEARVSPSDIGYINAHASSTPLNDSVEAVAMKLALGTAAERIPVSGTKGYHGHSLGASGSVEGAISLLAMEHDLLPYTLNLEHLDPRVDLPVIRDQPLAKHVDYVLSNSFGFRRHQRRVDLCASQLAMEIRPATAADVDQLVALWLELMTYHAGLTPTIVVQPAAGPAFRAKLAATLADPDQPNFVAVVDTTITGWFSGGRRSNLVEIPHGIIHLAIVGAGYRGQGVGRQLFGALREWFTTRGITNLTVGVSFFNPGAQRFWRALGFADHTNYLWLSGTDQDVPSEPLPIVVVTTDGSARGNPGPGGWAALLEANGQQRLISGSETDDTTNNAMEIAAVIGGLTSLKRPAHVLLRSDSQYVLNGIRRLLDGGTMAGTKRNAQLWAELEAAVKRHTLAVEWVRGHDGDPRNEQVDRAANAAANAAAAQRRTAEGIQLPPGAWTLALRSKDGGRRAQWLLRSGDSITTGNIQDAAATELTNLYRALLAALEHAADLPGSADAAIDVASSLETLIKQGRGEWRVKQPAQQPLAAAVADLRPRFGNFTYSYRPLAEIAELFRQAEPAA